MMAPATEKQLRSSIKTKLHSAGHRVFTMTPGLGIPSGTPDLLVWLKLPSGQVRVIFIEVKLPGGRLSPIQRAVIEGWLEFGVGVFVIHSLVELRETISELGVNL